MLLLLFVFTLFSFSCACSLPQCVFTSGFIFINNSITHPSLLGTINGLTQTINLCFRTVAPAAGASVFAWSIARRGAFPLDYHFFFVLQAGVQILLLGITASLPAHVDQPKFASRQAH